MHRGNLPPIISLSGIASSGKSTAANLLRALGYGGDHINAPMVEMARPLLRAMGIDEVEIEDRLTGARKNEPLPGYPHLTGRIILQKIGKDLRDALGVPGDVVDETFFLQLWASRNAHHPALVNESLRYEFEGDFTRACGGFVIRLTVPGLQPPNGHVSELFVPRHEIEIINHRRSEDELARLLDEAIELWRSNALNPSPAVPFRLGSLEVSD